MKTWIYSWIIYPLMYAIAVLVSFASPKVRDTLRLRAWKDFLSLRFNAGQSIEYWIHVASHGELEYAIPLLRELERRGKRVLLTYYSISAKGPVEQLPQTFRNVSLVVPLPHDGLGLMREFVALAHRQGVRRLLLMKYELWPGLLWECNEKGIRVLLVDALEPGWFHRRLLHKVDAILSGYESEIAGLRHRNILVVGDTRVERVLQRVEQSEERLAGAVPGTLRESLRQRPTLVCGSMWPPDDRALLGALERLGSRRAELNLIWVPHELDQAQAGTMRRALVGLGFLVHEFGTDPTDSERLSGRPLAIIVMKKGILAELYRLGQAAYVGGGFGRGIHSVWEPALCGIPVACGPRTERSPEARELAKIGRLKEVEGEEAMADWLGGRIMMTLPEREALAPLVAQHVGAASRIVEASERL